MGRIPKNLESGPKNNSTQITLSEINTLGVLKNPSLKNIVSYYGDPGDSRSGYLHPGFPDYWFAPGAQSHLHVPGTTGSGKVCLKFILRVTPLNPGEPKV